MRYLNESALGQCRYFSPESWAFDAAAVANPYLAREIAPEVTGVDAEPHFFAGSTEAPAAGASAASIPAGTVPGPGLPQPGTLLCDHSPTREFVDFI